MDNSSFNIVTNTLKCLSYEPPSFLIDVGASEGQYTSNSFYLLKDKLWSGLLIEPMLKQFKELQELYIDRPDIQCINAALTDNDGFCDIHLHPNDGDGSCTCNHGSSLIKPDRSNVSFVVPSISFKTISQQLPAEVGMLSIDTEGYDKFIINGLLSYGIRPHIIITEIFNLEHLDDKSKLLESYGYNMVVNTNHDTGWILS